MFANRTHSPSPSRLCSFACLGLATVLSLNFAAAARAESPNGETTIKLQIDGAATREHSTKKRIKSFELNPPDIVRARVLQSGYGVVVVAEKIGRTTVKLTDEDGKVDAFEVVVGPDVLPRVQIDVVVVQAHSKLFAKLASLVLKRPEVIVRAKGDSPFLKVPGVQLLHAGRDEQLPHFFTDTLTAFQDEQVRTFLSVLKDEGLVTILAEPRMKTVSGRLCTFLSGGIRIPQNIPVPAGLVLGQSEKIETSISCLPTVLKDRKIRFELEVETTSPPGEMNSTVHRTRTTLEAKPGETLLLGGWVSSTVGPKLKALPLFDASLPLGLAFYTRKMETEYSELFILITPKILE